MAEDKTNVIRLLEQAGVPHTPRQYDASDGQLDGLAAAARLGVPSEQCFKTLVTEGASRRNYVFVVPVAKELDLKAAARAVGEKSIQMIPQAKLLPLTGYVHGGCSPVGMKKKLPTVIDADAGILEQMTVSAGKIGRQVSLSPGDLAAYVDAEFKAVSK